MRRAALHSLGCKVNAYETEAMRQLLEEAGYRIVPFDEAADVYVVNTCSVTNIADRKSRQMLHRAKKKNPDSVVAAVGCYVQAAGARLAEDAAVDLVIGNNRKKDLVKILEAYFEEREAREGRPDNGRERTGQREEPCGGQGFAEQEAGLEQAGTENGEPEQAGLEQAGTEMAEPEKAEPEQAGTERDEPEKAGPQKTGTKRGLEREEKGKPCCAEKREQSGSEPRRKERQGSDGWQSRAEHTGIYMEDISREREYEELSVSRMAGHTRAFIKIQDGCNQFCSYCVIPYVRGRVRSRGAEEIVEEARRLVGAGFREIVLTGIHISSYGIDMPDERRTGLPELMERLDGIEGLARLRLGSLEPRVVTEEFARRMAGLRTICPHFHLSMQSGCDETLKRMNRHYTAAEYEERCRILRGCFDNPAITTDVIVGFPGETEEEFEQTEALIERIGFYELHVFPYSRREGTRAAAMDGQVGEAVKKERSARLLRLDREKSLAYRKSFLGQEREVLAEEKILVDGVEYLAGHTREYLRAAVPWDAEKQGRMLRGRLTKLLTDELLLLS